MKRTTPDMKYRPVSGTTKNDIISSPKDEESQFIIIEEDD
jgi:hypothetical protein